jgi:glycosyltransferase involved in cell wall biosynthesis
MIRRLRILFVINGMGRGGAEVQVMDLALALRRRGHAIAVVSVMPFLDFEGRLTDAGVETFTFALRGKLELPFALWRYAALVRKWRPDIVHAHMLSAILLTRVGRLFANVPLLVATSHTPLEFTRHDYWLYRFTHALGDRWTSVSRQGIVAHERARAVPAGQGILVRNGVDLTRFVRSLDRRGALRKALGTRDDFFLWLTVGSFRDEQKDYDTLLRAFARLHSWRPEARLAIAGGGRLLEAKRHLAHGLGIDSVVQFLGIRADVDALMSAADGFVLGSAWEAAPIVLLEAAAMELPIVATDVGENARLVQDGVAGIIVPSKSEEALATAMLRTMDRPSTESVSMGQASRDCVRALFDIEAVTTSWVEMYSAWLSELAAAEARLRPAD